MRLSEFLWCFLADIVRARLRTMGVDEHRFIIESGWLMFIRGLDITAHLSIGVRIGGEWCIFDVGGSRSMVRLHHQSYMVPQMV
jgi:hypothetical protein